MPKIVDHDARRRELLDATWRVIARDGLDATTFKRIADEAGHSIGALAHYFQGKDDILISAHQLAFMRARQRIVRATRELGGIEALRCAMHEALPLDAERYLEAQVDVSFLGQAVGNEQLRQVRDASDVDSRRLWLGFVQDAQTAGEIADDQEPDLVVDEVLVLIEALSIEAIISPARMTASRQVFLVDRFLARIGPLPER